MLTRNIKFIHYLVRKQYPVNAVSVTYRFKSSDSTKDKGKVKECPKDGSGRGFKYTIGGIIIGTGAIVALAKYDEDFRNLLKEHVPGSDAFIAFVTAEEGSHLEYILDYLNELKKQIVDGVKGLYTGSKEAIKGDGGVPCEDKPYKPPKPVYKELEGSEEEEEKAAAVKPADKEPPPQEAVEDEKPEEKKSTVPLKDIIELEKSINEAAKIACKAYSDATCLIKEHSGKICKLVEDSIEHLDPQVWKQLKESGPEKDKAIKDAIAQGKDAMEKIEQMKEYLKQRDLVGGDEVKQKAKDNIDKILAAVEECKKTFEFERDRSTITDKYWKKVQEARKHFEDELEILFPNVRLHDKNMKLADNELDLFILYAFQNIIFYQKELNKLDTLMKSRLRRALEDGKGNREVIQAAIDNEMENERRKIGVEFQKKMLMLRAECEKDMRLQMKRQEQAHLDHIAEAMELKEQEMERLMSRQLDEKIDEVKSDYKKELASLIGRLRALDDVVKKRASQDKKAQQSQVLWSACQTLESALRAGDPSLEPQCQLKPLQDEVQAVSNAAAPGDELVEAVVATIPEEALSRGVFTDMALRDRFLRVERVARRVALLPEGGASMPVMFLSYLQSLLVIDNPVAVPAHELANQPFDPTSLNTFDILQRARFWLDRGDFAQTLKYMNLLEGAPRAVARDWVRECRMFLEVQQAAVALMAHAAASGLIYS